ncbi:HPP family protein [Rhodanobacter sp. 7MK24]|uniref:HPP family protein n=1 Tax=Rhodanobacter sp. 7MK24 TaxID=2775922 RepID=UPI001786040A|nr:HPP family protein [Rhodanobacter sp. 7MK24]MBD8880832.1 HPP family protein [Rhodanobacter sp. 7MK24]
MTRIPGAELGSIVFIGVIAAAARMTGFDLLMFPELGALSNDIMKRPYGTWATAPVMLVITPLVTAVAGLWITDHLAFGVASVLLDVVVAMGVIELIQSPIAPGISAGLLPLVLQVHSWWYPPAITVGTGALAITGIVHRRFQPKPAVSLARDEVDDDLEKAAAKPVWLLPFALVLTALAYLATWTGRHFLLYPPLVVIGFEMFAHPLVCPWADRPWHLPLACTLSALIGVSLVTWLGAGVLAAMLSMAASVVTLRVLALRAPPVLAVGLLPMVLNSPDYSFAASVLVGTLILTISFRLWQATCLRFMGLHLPADR